MAGERLPARFSLRSQPWFQRTGKCFETATSHMQTVGAHAKKTSDTLTMTSNDRYIKIRTNDKNDKRPSLRIFENFCQRTLHTFAKQRRLTLRSSFAKECNFANTQKTVPMNPKIGL